MFKMTKIYIFYFSFIMAILISTIAIGQVVVFGDNFDTYSFNQQISCQAPTIWKTWTNNPCNPTEDAYVSNVYSFSGANSVVIKQNNDIVKEIGTPISSGIAEINFQVYIPAGKSGYFNTLGNFNPPTYSWAMQVFLNATGTGTIDAGGASAATFSYPQNQWFPIKIIADLTADSGMFYLNGNLIRKWRWTAGTFGSTITKQLDGIDFYGYVATDEMYIDDYNIVQLTSSNKISSTVTGGNWSSNSTWVGGVIPGPTNTVEIVAGSTVTLNGSIVDRNLTTIVNGTLVCGIYNIIGSGDFSLGGGGTIQIGSPEGITLSSPTGNIQTTGTRTYSQFANYIYNGTSSQVTGNALPSTIRNLTISNSSGVSLTSNTSVSGALNLIDGNFLTSTNSLSLGTSATNLGALSVSSGKIIGNVNRWISNLITPVTFPVGTSPTKYTPVILSDIVGLGTFLVSAIDGLHPSVSNPNFLQMYWKLTNGGLTSTTITFNYSQTDVVGDENSYSLFRYDGSWTPFSPITLNTSNNTVIVNNVSTFSDWTLGVDDPLPVELTSFSAATIGSTVKLNWQTATEINNFGFEIERGSHGSTSLMVTDWEKIGFVNGSGNSNSPKNYSFEDKNVKTGKYQYRLKQIDNDGQVEYSKIVEIHFNNEIEYSLSQNFPNPFNPNTTISFTLPRSGNVRLTIFNLLGQEIQTLTNGFKEAGVYAFNFDAKILNSGIYLYKLETDGFTQTRKMTLIR
jgi:Secretion system C-terminal sorting domain